jgi:hypothetical protein
MSAKQHGFWALVAACMLVALASPALAGGRWHGHGYGYGYGHGYRGGWGYYGPRVVVGVGPAYYGYWGRPYYWGPAYYPPYYVPAPVVYPVYAPAPRVIVQEPPVYIEREADREAEIEQQLEAGSWYYCQSAGAYYPDAQSCPEPWVKVPPRP